MNLSILEKLQNISAHKVRCSVHALTKGAAFYPCTYAPIQTPFPEFSPWSVKTLGLNTGFSQTKLPRLEVEQNFLQVPRIPARTTTGNNRSNKRREEEEEEMMKILCVVAINKNKKNKEEEEEG